MNMSQTKHLLLFPMYLFNKGNFLTIYFIQIPLQSDGISYLVLICDVLLMNPVGAYSNCGFNGIDIVV